MKVSPAVYRPTVKATPTRFGTHAIAAGVVLWLLCGPAYGQFIYDAGAWYPGMPIPAIPSVPPVPNIYPPVLLPNTGLPVVAPPTSTPPTIPIATTPDVILNMTAQTISGCKYEGRLCVHGLPVVRSGNTATGSIGGLLFTFQTQ